MSKLLKYEFRKTRFPKLVVLGVAAVLEIVFLIGVAGRVQRLMTIGAIGLFMVAVCGIMWIGLDSVLVFSRDLNTKQSYMLFMTPNSSYKILGAKVLENGLSVLVSGLCFFLVGLGDIILLSDRYREVNRIRDYANMILDLLGSDLSVDPVSFLLMTGTYLSTWITILTLADLAIVLSGTFFSGKRYSLLVSFLIFIGLVVAVSFLINALPSLHTFAGNNILYICVLLGITAAVFTLTGRIMDRKLSV